MLHAAVILSMEQLNYESLRLCLWILPLLLLFWLQDLTIINYD